MQNRVPSTVTEYDDCYAPTIQRVQTQISHSFRLRRSSATSLVSVSDCAPYAAVDVRRPSFPGRRLASLEQSATSRHVCTQSLPVFCSRLKTHLFSRSFPRLHCRACEVTLVNTDTLIVVLTYLLNHTATVALVVPIATTHVWRGIT